MEENREQKHNNVQRENHEQEIQHKSSKRVGRKEIAPKGDKKKIMLVLFVAIILLAGGIFAYVYVQNEKVKTIMMQEGIYPGITIDGMNVEGMSKAEAVEMLETTGNKKASNQTVTLAFGEETWAFTFQEINADYSVEEAVETAYNIGREGTEKEKFQVVAALLKDSVDIPLVFTYDTTLLETKMTEVAEAFNREVVNSTMTRKNGRFSIEKEAEGREMDMVLTSRRVDEVVASMVGGTVEIAANAVTPTVTYEDNARVTDLLASFSTKYTQNKSDRNRNINLEVGTKYMNGGIIAPGEVYSATAGLGSQTYDGGYRDAGVYVNGKVEDGMAGGVCQITTTLYNAAIFAELEIVERHPHSMTVGYVPLGRDAAIADNYKDLRIKNNTDAPIYIEAYAVNGVLAVNLYGHETRSGSRKVEFETVFEASIPKPAEIVKKDPEKPEGEREITHKGRTGSKVSVYKKVSENGKQVSKEWFSSSSYRAVADEVTVGTKPPAAISPPDVATDVVPPENLAAAEPQ